MADQTGYDQLACGLIEDGKYQIINNDVLAPGYPLFRNATLRKNMLKSKDIEWWPDSGS